MIYGTCEACNAPVDSQAMNPAHRLPAFPVEGWEVPRDGGGTNHIRGRRRVPNRVRHVGCLEAEAREGQEVLL